MGYLQKVDYKIAHSEEDRSIIYRLRYDAYIREEAIKPHPSMMFHDDYDDLENCWIFSLSIDEQLVSSVRVHVISPEHPKGPALDVFPDIVGPMVFEQGCTIIDPTRFVASPEFAAEYPELPYFTLRAAFMAVDYYNADYCLATVRKEHMAFYRRVFRAEILSEPRPYPSLQKPIAIMCVDVPKVRNKIARRYPIFESSFTERRFIFNKPDTIPENKKPPVLVSSLAS
ncbi:MAG: hypothetical protein AAGA76_11200 [Pseudomonadota bacterium]